MKAKTLDLEGYDVNPLQCFFRTYTLVAPSLLVYLLNSVFRIPTAAPPHHKIFCLSGFFKLGK